MVVTIALPRQTNLTSGMDQPIRYMECHAENNAVGLRRSKKGWEEHDRTLLDATMPWVGSSLSIDIWARAT